MRSAPPLAGAGTRLEFSAEDGTDLSATWRRGRSGGEGAVLVLPGFWRHADSPRIADLAAVLSRRHDVFTLDFRGHGRSRGRFTLGQAEHLDVLALLQAVARAGLRRVVLVGMSMGGAALVTALARGREAGLPVDVAGAVLISSPARFGLIRPKPWRGGRRDVAWSDVLRVPRIDWRFPFTRKLAAEEAAADLPRIPVRVIHARRDWLVDDALGRRLVARLAAPAEMLLLDVPGSPHADELLGRVRHVMLRLLEPWILARLSAGRAPGDGAGRRVEADPWRAGFAAHVQGLGGVSADLGGLRPSGDLEDLLTLDAGRDGVHVAACMSGRWYCARGLRDGSVHGLNLLGTALVADGPAWPEAVVRELSTATGVLRHPPCGAADFRTLTLRGERGFEVS